MRPAGSGEGAPSHERLPRAARIRRGIEIREILRKGSRTRASHLEVFWLPDPVSGPRFGTIVPKHGHTVVERNLVRRRLKEIGRTEVLPRLRSSGRDTAVLVRSRPSAYGTPFSTLRDELVRITEGLCSEPSSSS
ncbi:MAG: ribonuclease P protein component [Gemmatimonadales bacterium]|nr:MAG: ribonuclease P protein component [Gemmatimonadales bacterium]